MVATISSNNTTTTNNTNRLTFSSSSNPLYQQPNNETMTTTNDSNNYSNNNNATNNKYSPKPFIISKERFRSVSSASNPSSLNYLTSSQPTTDETTQQIQQTHQPTTTIRDLNLPTVRKSRRKKPMTTSSGENPLSEEEYRRLMMLKRKSRFIYSSSAVNSRQKENYDEDEASYGDESTFDEDEVMMNVGGVGEGGEDFSNLFDNLEGQDLETQFNNFLNALQGRRTADNNNSSNNTSSLISSSDVHNDNSNSNNINSPHYHHDANNNNTNNNEIISSSIRNQQYNNNAYRHSDIPRVLMEHFQKEEDEWKQQVRQLNASREATTLNHLPDKHCQMSTFTLNNNGLSTESDLFESHHAAGLNKLKNKNSNNSAFVSSTLEEQRRGHHQQYSSHHNFNNSSNNNNNFASSFSGAEGSHLLINNNPTTFNYTKPFYTTHSMMNENEYLQATSSATDYSYPTFNTDDESSLMFDDDRVTDSSPFEKLILDDDELLDYGDCDTYGEVDEFNMHEKTPTMEDDMYDESSFYIEQTPPPQRPIYLSLQTLPVSPLMSATNSELTHPRKSSTSGGSSGINSPSSSRTTNNLNNNNTLLTSADELDVFNADSSLTTSNENNTAVTGSPIDPSRKSKVRRSSSSIPSEEFNKFLQISSPQQQQLFAPGSPARAHSPTTSSMACSPGKMSSHHSRKLSNHGIGHVRRNSGIKKQPRANSYTVSSILGDSQLKTLFFDFLNEHHNSELVLFLQEEEEFRADCQNCIATNIGKLMMEYEIKMERIKQIFEAYIKPGSNSELNLSNETRLKIESRVKSLLIPPVISRHKGVGDLHLSRWISPDTFEAATTEVKISLKNHILPLFLESPRFENYLVQKHIQDNTVSNLRGKKIQRMLGYYIPESAKDTFYVNGATVGLSNQQQQTQQPHQSQHHHFSTINDPTSKKSRPKKSLTALFGNNHHTPSHNNPTIEQPVLNDTSPKSPFKNEQHKNQSLSKFKNWILGKRNPAESPNPSSSWSTLSKKSQLTVNNASNSAPQLVGTSSHIKISPREMESDPNKKVSNAFSPLTMSTTQSTPEINSLINDGILFIKVHTKKRGNCKILEINIDKMSILSEQDKKLANQLKNVLLTHTDADVNPFDKYPHLREFLQTKISVQSQKNWEEINEDCIIKVKSPPTSHFFKL